MLIMRKALLFSVITLLGLIELQINTALASDFSNSVNRTSSYNQYTTNRRYNGNQNTSQWSGARQSYTPSPNRSPRNLAAENERFHQQIQQQIQQAGVDIQQHRAALEQKVYNDRKALEQQWRTSDVKSQPTSESFQLGVKWYRPTDPGKK
jgi:hypothetical protein